MVAKRAHLELAALNQEEHSIAKGRPTGPIWSLGLTWIDLPTRNCRIVHFDSHILRLALCALLLCSCSGKVRLLNLGGLFNCAACLAGTGLFSRDLCWRHQNPDQN